MVVMVTSCELKKASPLVKLKVLHKTRLYEGLECSIYGHLVDFGLAQYTSDIGDAERIRRIFQHSKDAQTRLSRAKSCCFKQLSSTRICLHLVIIYYMQTDCK